MVSCQPFDRCHRFACCSGDRQYAGFDRLAVEMHGACPTQTGTATKLGPLELESVPDHPQQGCLRIPRKFDLLSIQCKRNHGINLGGRFLNGWVNSALGSCVVLLQLSMTYRLGRSVLGALYVILYGVARLLAGNVGQLLVGFCHGWVRFGEIPWI